MCQENSNKSRVGDNYPNEQRTGIYDIFTVEAECTCNTSSWSVWSSSNVEECGGRETQYRYGRLKKVDKKGKCKRDVIDKFESKGCVNFCYTTAAITTTTSVTTSAAGIPFFRLMAVKLTVRFEMI